MSFASSYSGVGFDKYQARGRLTRDGARKGCLLFGGWTSVANDWIKYPTLWSLGWTLWEVTRGLSDYGIPCATLGTGETWGVGVFPSQASTLRTNAISSGHFASGKVHLVGVSMGSLCALRWAEANPTLVASMTLTIPGLNPQRLWDTDPLGVGIKASITAAFGGRPSDANTPSTHPSDWSGFPIQIFYSTNDQFINRLDPEGFAAGSGATLISQGAPGYGLPTGHVLSYTVFDPRRVGDFITAND